MASVSAADPHGWRRRRTVAKREAVRPRLAILRLTFGFRPSLFEHDSAGIATRPRDSAPLASNGVYAGSTPSSLEVFGCHCGGAHFAIIRVAAHAAAR
jgi:hypothetical protein